MFSGIVRHVGKIADISNSRGNSSLLMVNCPEGFLANCELGDSVCVDGCCLSLAERDQGLREARFNLSPETIARTAVLAKGAPVHLEHSLRVGEQLGGHFVFGHVDGTSRILEVVLEGDCTKVTMSIPKSLDSRLVAALGSVAIAGVSLTVTRTNDDRFSLQLIPVTQQSTHLNAQASLVVGKELNFEADYLARYAIRD